MHPFARPLVFDHPAFDGHEEVIFCSDSSAGLRAIIAIHDTTLGPALGGTRMWAYEPVSAALEDALRLARAMTYKNALAGIAFGGAKAVIIGDPRADKSEALLRAYATHVDGLGGRFVTGEDVGITIHDADVMVEVCPHIRGTSRGKVGDPSPYTALGVFKGIEAAVAHRLGSTDLKGVRVCIQGLGNVGMRLGRLLHRAGAKLTVSDIRADVVAHAETTFGARGVEPRAAHAAEVDVYAPCALGAILNSRTIPEIRASVVAGSANAQIEKAEDGENLRQRGILYAPDYVINAGGVLSIAHDGPAFDPLRLRRDVLNIANTLRRIFERADAEGKTTSTIADRLAEERLASARCPVAA